MADSYIVTSQREVVGTDEAGQVVPMMEVTFKTRPSEVVARVRIPLAQYSTSTVAEAIEAQASVIESVAAL